MSLCSGLYFFILNILINHGYLKRTAGARYPRGITVRYVEEKCKCCNFGGRLAGREGIQHKALPHDSFQMLW